MKRDLQYFRTEMKQLVRARFPIIHIATLEEDRALKEIGLLAEQMKHEVMLWSASRGVFTLSDDPGLPKGKLGQLDLLGALEIFEARAIKRDRFLGIMLDPYPYLTEKNSNRRLRKPHRRASVPNQTDLLEHSEVVPEILTAG